MKNSRIIREYTKLNSFKDADGSIAGYALQNDKTLDIEYFYTEEITDDMRIKTSEISKHRNERRNYLSGEKLRELSIYGLDELNIMSRYCKINIDILKEELSHINEYKYILGIEFDSIIQEDKTNLYILYRNVAFYNIPVIHLYNKGIEIGELRATFEVDYDTAIILFKPKNMKNQPSRFFRGTVEEAKEFIRDILSIKKSNNRKRLKDKYKEDVIQPQEDRLKIINCVLSTSEISTIPCGELVGI